MTLVSLPLPYYKTQQYPPPNPPKKRHKTMEIETKGSLKRGKVAFSCFRVSKVASNLLGTISSLPRASLVGRLNKNVILIPHEFLGAFGVRETEESSRVWRCLQ